MSKAIKIVAIIPARMASTRFPGKPLADILGLPMIEHIRRRVALCDLFERVVVATCDREIFVTIKENGGEAIMTADTHERCTDRIAEAALSIDADLIVNVQGDEPLVNPDMFKLLIKPLLEEKALQCANLMAEITDEEEFNNANVVKTVCDQEMNALYFSREPVPSIRKAGDIKYKKYKQLGVVAFRKQFLGYFAKLPPTPLEKLESVDMLRALEHGYKVRMVISPFQVVGVDTPKDLEKVITLMKKDPLIKSYFESRP